MKITDVEALYLRLPEIQARTDSSQDALIVKVSTDAGITGWGEVDGCPYVDQGDHRGADVAHPGDRPARAAARRGPARDRPAVAQDVSGHAVLRPRGRGDPGDGRDRPGALGHQGQGAPAAGVQAAGRRLSQAGAGLRLEHVPVHRRGDRGRARGRRRTRASPRSSSAGSRSAGTRRPTAPISMRSGRGRRRHGHHARRRADLGRQDHAAARPPVRALSPRLDRGAAARPTISRATPRSRTAPTPRSPPARRSARSRASPG